MTNFAAAPPALRNSAKYSRSITPSQSFGFNGSVRISSIWCVRDKPHGIVIMLGAALIEHRQAFGALGAGGATQFEAVGAGGASVGVAVEAQQIDKEFLDRVIRRRGRQQR